MLFLAIRRGNKMEPDSIDTCTSVILDVLLLQSLGTESGLEAGLSALLEFKQDLAGDFLQRIEDALPLEGNGFDHRLILAT